MCCWCLVFVVFCYAICRALLCLLLFCCYFVVFCNVHCVPLYFIVFCCVLSCYVVFYHILSWFVVLRWTTLYFAVFGCESLCVVPIRRCFYVHLYYLVVRNVVVVGCCVVLCFDVFYCISL